MTAKILVVDDEVDLQELIKRKFRREIRTGEFDFRFAESGAEALKILQNGSDIDLVLSDINMPGMSGLELLHHLGEYDTQLKTVMVSAYGDMDNIREAMNAGAFDFVTKPIDFGDLLITIKKTLDELDVLKEAFRLRAEAEAQRTNLARYFPPNLVETLAGLDDPFGEPREQPVAVMFVDIVGFTALAATLPAKEVFRLLREFHSRMAQAVFAAHGTLDKFIGDGLMATFGTPTTGDRDATNALRCAFAMIDAVEEVNADRRGGGKAEVSLGIGLHYGPVMLGNIGDARRLEFAVLGETVNIASRLEGLTRPLGATIVISEAMVEAVRAETPENVAELDKFSKCAKQAIRGLKDDIPVWAYHQETR
ncbi:MAG: adenylate/guanylate cyclase domain-containing protein [Alphaproteobacteria bacterium]|nr:adenylate/guanylate cyclase domain-containing protein [Alphaproteobacteria bacterium]